MRPRVLLIDDDPGVIASMTMLLAPTCDLLTARRGRQGLALFDLHHPDLLLLDIRLPDQDGLSLLRTIRAEDADIPIVMMTGLTEARTAVTAMKLGADEYLTKPIDPHEFLRIVENYTKGAPPCEGDKESRHHSLRQGVETIIGATPIIQTLREQIVQAARAHATVVITGESGTGKELVAKALHCHSPRRAQEFVALNCAALPDTLIENELFGHERGAFTDAHTRQIGHVELAHKGTLFLDEVSELSPLAQVKLLRLLQEREFRRIGGTERIVVDIRLIAATNKSLHALVAAGRFREDLFYRLNVVTLTLPPLRDRSDDVPILASHFLAMLRDQHPGTAAQFSADAMDCLRRYHWPGNVRELDNVVEQAAVWCTGPEILPVHLPRSLQAQAAREPLQRATVQGQMSLERAVQQFEEGLILDALAQCGYIQTQAAAHLGISRRQLKYRMDALGITIPPDGPDPPRRRS